MTPTADHWQRITDDIGALLAPGSPLLRFLASLPDGYATRTPGSGIPSGGSGISDPTQSAALRAVEHPGMVAIDQAARDLYTLAMDAWSIVARRDVRWERNLPALALLARAMEAAASVALRHTGEDVDAEMHGARRALRQLAGALPPETHTITDADRAAMRCPGWGPRTGTCANHKLTRLKPDGPDPTSPLVLDLGAVDRLCARCEELRTWRCRACGEGLGDGPWPDRWETGGMHSACYLAAWRAGRTNSEAVA